MKKILFLIFALSACATKPQKSDTYFQVTLPSEKSRSQYDATSSRFMVSTQGLLSTQAGIEVLKKGGNLFDAFTAISFAIGVERPHSTGIGGGGFVLFYSAREKKVYSFDFRETAPKKATENMFLGSDGMPDPNLSITGGLSVATPGHVAGVLEIQKKFGNLKLEEVMAPSIRMASEGINVYGALYEAINSEQQVLSKFPSSKKIFLDSEGKPWPIGHKLIQKDLAKTLKLIAKKGPSAFYEGEIAKKISESVKKNGGVLELTDLKNYRALWREPVKTIYHDYEVFSQPLPSAGGLQIIEILNTLENAHLKEAGPQSAKAVHLTAAAMQQTFYDRAVYMGDPDFVKVPTEKTGKQRIR
jgi:gamma-glutamyltranspeptidase / glutathione hydrolase